MVGTKLCPTSYRDRELSFVKLFLYITSYNFKRHTCLFYYDFTVKYHKEEKKEEKIEGKKKSRFEKDNDKKLWFLPHY